MFLLLTRYHYWLDNIISMFFSATASSNEPSVVPLRKLLALRTATHTFSGNPVQFPVKNGSKNQV